MKNTYEIFSYSYSKYLSCTRSSLTWFQSQNDLSCDIKPCFIYWHFLSTFSLKEESWSHVWFPRRLRSSTWKMCSKCSWKQKLLLLKHAIKPFTTLITKRKIKIKYFLYMVWQQIRLYGGCKFFQITNWTNTTWK